MSRTIGLLAVLALSASTPGCSKGSCLVVPTGEECSGMDDMGTSSSMTVSPLRIPNRVGGKITVTFAKPPSAGEIWLRQGTTAQEKLGAVNGSASQQFDIPTDLRGKKFVVKEAEIALVRPGQPDAAAKVWVSRDFETVTPIIRATAKDVNANGNDYPVWVGIAKKKLVVLNYSVITTTSPLSGISQQNTADYNFSGSDFLYNMSNPSKLSNQYQYPGHSTFTHKDIITNISMSVGAAVTDSDAIFASFEALNKMSSFLQSCPVLTPCSAAQVVPYKNIVALAGARSADLFAGIFDGNLRAFSSQQLTDMSGVVINPAPAAPVAAAQSMTGIGRINEDSAADLVTLLAGDTPSVYLFSQGQLTRDMTLSDSLKKETSGIPGVSGAITALAVGDLDGDPWHDIIISIGNQLIPILNQGDGTFKRAAAIPSPFMETWSIAIGDIENTNAGVADIALASWKDQKIAVLVNSATP
jgi:hypothetical protein